MIETVLSKTSGSINNITMKIVWEETDIDRSANTSKLRVRQLLAKATDGNTTYVSEFSNDVHILVNNVDIVTIGWGQMHFDGNYGSEYRAMGTYDFDEKVVQTGALTHASDGSLTISVALNGSFGHFRYTSPTTTELEYTSWNGTGSTTIEGGGGGGGGETQTDWLTLDGEKAFLAAAGEKIEGAAMIAGETTVAAQIVSKTVTENNRLAVLVETGEDVTALTVTKVQLLDEDGTALVTKNDSFALTAGQKNMYWFVFGIAGK